MAAAKSPLPIAIAGVGSRELIRRESSNEFFFAVVGHAGSGTSFVAKTLGDFLRQTKLDGCQFDVEILKARTIIEEWARKNGKHVPSPEPKGKRKLPDVKLLQDYGDEMRAETAVGGEPDYAAVARGLVLRLREVRAGRLGVSADSRSPIIPDGTPRAYILDALRHPAEVMLLRRLYGDAFMLVGVVCEENKRIDRMTEKYADCGKQNAVEFMRRDADAKEPHGQHVADAFHLSDFFVDNTVDREISRGRSNPDWEVSENLSRLVKIVTHSELLRPSVAETAMCHAYDAKMQSACLSRQVGAALVDSRGNVVATGTNEVPMAGGGVYGESFDPKRRDARCAMFNSKEERFCRNTRQQNEIIDELLDEIQELNCPDEGRRGALRAKLQRTRIGSLLEFSRAVHAEMDALLSAARKGAPLGGTRLFVTTFPCHYCARHIIAAGVDEVQYIEPYPKSEALKLHRDAMVIEKPPNWREPSRGGDKLLFRPFSGVAPRMYRRAFLKDRELKDKRTGMMKIAEPDWGTPWRVPRTSYAEMEVKLLNGGTVDG